jgi:ABC-type phosphate transport system substrate-binding protein
MRKTFLRVAAATLTLLLSTLATAKSAQAQDFKVIVNSANSTSSLSAAEASKIFLKEAAKFPNGTSASPVDLSKSSPVRAAFSKSVVGRPVGAIESYWQQQIFSGKDVPPSAKSSDDEVIAFVKANPGGIGYVSAGASTAGVKVIDVK